MNLLAKIGFFGVLFGLLAGGTATGLYADPAGGWLSPSGQGSKTTVRGGSVTNTASTTTSSGGAAQSGGAGVTVTLSAADIQLRVRQLHDQTRADARHIQHLQQVARKQKDIIKLNCVNDKLVQVKPQMNIADRGESELEAATDANRMAIFDTIAQAAENVRRLREEADQCIGEPIMQGGESSNSFTGPHAPDDPTKGFDPEIEPPGYASPFN